MKTNDLMILGAAALGYLLLNKKTDGSTPLGNDSGALGGGFSGGSSGSALSAGGSMTAPAAVKVIAPGSIPKIAPTSVSASGHPRWDQAAQTAKIKRAYGPNTQVDVNVGGNPLISTVHTVGGGSHNIARAPVNQAEHQAARAANIANLKKRGLW